VTDTLDWIEKTVDIPAGGLGGARDATGEELKQIANALNILNVASLSSRYRISSISGGAYRLTGSVAAQVEQACVVSLEPVNGNVQAPFEVEFWPNLEVEESEDESSILGASEVELLEHGIIPVGRIVFETLSASLDPYPRKEGAEFTWQDSKSEASDGSNPFAALAKLKDKS
jgi:uncharacterized metal-binding protein YceD (DUF177 family)